MPRMPRMLFYASGEDSFSDPVFCYTLYMFRTDLLPMILDKKNYNNSNSEIKLFRCCLSFRLSTLRFSLLQKNNLCDTPPPPDLWILNENLSKFHLSLIRRLALSNFKDKPTSEQPRQGTDLPFQSRKFTNPSC